MFSQITRVELPRHSTGRGSRGRPVRTKCTILITLVMFSGCSVSRFATESMANVLAEDSVVYAADEDIDLVGDATPFALKTTESLIARLPEHRGLLTAAVKGFIQYAYVYVHLPAEELEERDVDAAYEQRARAKRLYLRARNYGLRGLGFDNTAALQGLHGQPVQSVNATTKEDLELLYWTGVAWAAAISLGKNEPGLIAELPVVDAIIGRAFVLDPNFDDGGLHTFLIGYEMSQSNAGASAVERAWEHFQRAITLSKGQKAAPYIAMAESVAVPRQRRSEFEQLLNQALAVDANARPEWRLANLVMQRRARWLLARTDTLFVE